MIRTKGGEGSSIGVVRCCTKRRSVPVNASSESPSARRGSGKFPAVMAKIAVSRLMTSATVGQACLSGWCKSREEPQLQQDGGASEPLRLGRTGSSIKQTAHLSRKGSRWRTQWVCKAHAHSLRIQAVRVARTIS